MRFNPLFLMTDVADSELQKFHVWIQIQWTQCSVSFSMKRTLHHNSQHLFIFQMMKYNHKHQETLKTMMIWTAKTALSLLCTAFYFLFSFLLSRIVYTTVALLHFHIASLLCQSHQKVINHLTGLMKTHWVMKWILISSTFSLFSLLIQNWFSNESSVFQSKISSHSMSSWRTFISL